MGGKKLVTVCSIILLGAIVLALYFHYRKTEATPGAEQETMAPLSVEDEGHDYRPVPGDDGESAGTAPPDEKTVAESPDGIVISPSQKNIYDGYVPPGERGRSLKVSKRPR